MATLGDLSVVVGAKIEGFERSMGTVSQRLGAIDREANKAFSGFDKLGGRITSLGTQLTTMALPLVGTGAAAVALAGNFETSFNKVMAFSGTTGAALDRLKGQALELGAKTAFSAQQAADGMGILASAGFNAEQIMATMPGVLNLAAAGQIAVAEAAVIAKDTLGQFGLAANQAGLVADVLAQASLDTSSNMGELGSALTYVGPVAHGAGQSLYETTAAIVALDAAGIRGTAAGTGLRGVIGSLLAPSKEAAGHIADLGVKISDSEGKIRPLSAIMDDFKGALGRVGSEAERQNVVFQVFGREAGNAAQILINTGGPALDAFEQKLIDNGNAATRVAGQLNTGFNYQMDQLKGSVETAGIALGNVLLPSIGRVLDGFTGLVNNAVLPAVSGFGKLPQPVQDTGLALAAVTAAAGPVIFVTGQMVSSFASLGSGLTAARGYIEAAGGSMKLLHGTMTTMVPVALAAGTAFAAFNELKRLSADLSETAGHLGDLAEHFRKALPPASDFQGVLDRGKPIIDAHRFAVEKLGGALDTLGTALGKANQVDWWETLKRGAIGPLGTIVDLVEGLNRKLVDLKGLLGVFPEMDAAVAKVAQSQQDFVGATTRLSDAALTAYASSKGLTGGINDADRALKGLIPTTKTAAGGVSDVGEEHKKATPKVLTFWEAVIEGVEKIKRGQHTKVINDTAEAMVNLQRILQTGANTPQAFAAELQKLAGNLGDLSTAIKDLPQMPGFTGTIKELDDVGEAYKRLGITSTGELRGLRDQALADFNTIKNSGISTTGEMEKGWVRWAEAAVAAAKQAGEDIPIEIEGMLSASKTKMDTGTAKLKTPWQTLSGEVSTVMTNLTQDLSKMLWDGNLSFAEKFKGSLKSLGEAVTSSFIQPATAAITGFITGTLADLIGGKGFGGVLGRIGELGSGIAGIFSGLGGGLSAGAGGAAAAGSQAVNAIVGPAGGAASAGAGVAKAASGALGMVNIASSVLSSVTDVLSFLGQRHIEKDVAGIEVTTRAIFAEIFNLRADSWDRETHLMLKLDDLWTTLREGFGNDYVRQGDILHEALKTDDLISAVRSIGSVVSVPITTVGESIEDQLSRMRSDLVGAQAARGGLEALHRSFESIDSLYGRFLNEGPELFAEALRITGAAEADALAVGVSDTLKQSFSTLYGLIASGQGLEDHAIFRALSLVTGGIQAEMEKLGDYEQLGGQVRSLESTIERLEKERAQRERNTIGFLVGVNESGFAAVVDALKAIGATLADGFSGFVKQAAPPIASAPATPAGPLLGSGADPLAAAARTRIGQLDTEMAAILARVDFVRNLAKGDYNPTAELADLWTMVTRDAAGEWAARVEERAALEALAFRNTPINQRPIQVDLVVDGIRLGNAIVSATELAGGAI